MKIDEAIEALTVFRDQESALLGNEFAQASALGIEALKCIKDHRAEFGNIPYTGLPSETK